MKDIRAFKNKQKQIYQKLIKSSDNLLTNTICRNCHVTLKHSTLPKYATPQNIRMNNALQYVYQLTQLEECLVSLRIAFAQIWELGYKRSQVGLTGSIINVPVDTNVVQRALPLSTNNTTTIAVSLKRRLEYKNAFQKGMVRPTLVMQALQELTTTTLYKMQDVQLNQNWKQALEMNNDIEENP